MSYTITRMDVAWRNGAINLVREPVEAVPMGLRRPTAAQSLSIGDCRATTALSLARKLR